MPLNDVSASLKFASIHIGFISFEFFKVNDHVHTKVHLRIHTYVWNDDKKSVGKTRKPENASIHTSIIIRYYEWSNMLSMAPKTIKGE